MMGEGFEGDIATDALESMREYEKFTNKQQKEENCSNIKWPINTRKYPCPNCGYCPHCGRGGQQWWWQQPVYC